jgi:hypothetical protein
MAQRCEITRELRGEFWLTQPWWSYRAGIWGVTGICRGLSPALGASSQRVVPWVRAGIQTEISDHVPHLLGKQVLDNVARYRTRSSSMAQA